MSESRPEIENVQSTQGEEFDPFDPPSVEVQLARVTATSHEMGAWLPNLWEDWAVRDQVLNAFYPGFLNTVRVIDNQLRGEGPIAYGRLLAYDARDKCLSYQGDDNLLLFMQLLCGLRGAMDIYKSSDEELVSEEYTLHSLYFMTVYAGYGILKGYAHEAALLGGSSYEGDLIYLFKRLPELKERFAATMLEARTAINELQGDPTECYEPPIGLKVKSGSKEDPVAIMDFEDLMKAIDDRIERNTAAYEALSKIR